MANILKKLELVGFKSFAQKTVLEFNAGITAIVGPNGSGKSNVIDSIRWLLGEREAKNLRGGKSEDLIFAGSSKKPRMGLASASLYFDNQTKFFPVDFSEVVISRETHRDGSNYYFLNKNEIRLKDLIDFLAKARLGTQGMIIVSQGNSDMFVRVSPEERREMIEETLGLREYRLKKSEAERKLKNTKINLDKVRALIEEILPHLRSLRRQTSRFQKRGELEEELNHLLKIFFGSSAKKIKDDLEKINLEINSHLKQKAHLLDAKIKAEQKLKEIENNQPKEKEELNKIKAQINELIQKRSELQKELGRIEFRLESEIQKHNESDLDSQTLLNFISDIKLKIQKLINNDLSFEQIKKSLNEIISDIENLSKPKHQKEINLDIEKEFKKINETLKGIENEIEALRKEEKRLEESQEGFYNMFRKAVEDLRQAENNFEKWEASNQNLIFQKEKIEIKLGDLKHQISQFGRSFSEFENVNVEEEIDFSEVERKIWRLRGELASLGEIDEALLKEAEETEKRYAFLEKESVDLQKASEDLEKLIKELNLKIEEEFKKAFSKINVEFDKFFKAMFGGGWAKLKLISLKKEQNTNNNLNEENAKENQNNQEEKLEDEFEEKGIDIEVKLPMKKLTSLDVLSGGERSLIGIAALFSIISVSPPPFLVLDEIDAMLDERNARRFSQMLKEFSHQTQFIIVTHNRAVMEAADIIYGVTLDEDETSKIVSLKLEK